MKKLTTYVTIVFAAVIALFACACKTDKKDGDISLDKTEITLKQGESGILTLKENGIVVLNGIKWTTSDKNVAEVTDGKVTAVSSGTAKITAEYKSVKSVCLVTVENLPETRLSEEKLYLSVGDTETLYLIKNGEKVADGVLWESSDGTTASVTAGKITCLGKGSVTITAEYENETYSCFIEVNSSPVGSYTATVIVEEMDGAEFVFDLNVNSDKTYTYSRRDYKTEGEDGYIAGEKVNEGTWSFEQGGVMKFVYPGGEMRMKQSVGSVLKSVGEIVTGGMDSEITFKKN